MERVISSNPLLIKERIPYLDYSRIFAAYLVILGHLLPYDNIVPRMYIYSFHMGFFFLVSGMLHKKADVIPWKKYVKTLIVPAIFFNILLWMLEAPFWYLGLWDYSARFYIAMPNSFAELLSVTGVNTIKAFLLGGKYHACSGPCWFLIALFVCKVAADLINKYGKIALFVSICLFFATAYYKHNFLFMGSSLMALPFFLLGVYGKSFIHGVCKKKYCALGGAVGFVAMLLLANVNGQASMYGVSFGQNYHKAISVILFYFVAFLGSLSLLTFFALLKKTYPIITSLATSLITILGFQLFFVYIGWYMIDTLHSNIWISVVLSFPILFLCFFVHKLIKKFCPFFLGIKHD